MSETSERTAAAERLAAALEPLRADPERSAVLSDLDGTLAPIAERPGETAIDPRAPALFERLAGSYGTVAIVSGRRAEAARAIVGVDAITYIGNHGYELLEPGAGAALAAPTVKAHADTVPRFAAARLDPEELAAAGVRSEDKGPIVALHWRGADDEDAAERLVARLASEAEGEDLLTHRGRKVVELRPPVEIDKGVAIEALLRERGSRAALYAGDDRTDVDGFRALRRLRGEGALDAAVTVAVRSAEAAAEVVEAAELVVDGPAAMPELLGMLVR